MARHPRRKDQIERDTLPVSPLALLAATGFISILTETLPAGLLPQISADLGISREAAGQFVTVYAIGSIVAAIPLVTATQHRARKPLLLAALGFMLAGNLVTTISHNYALTLAARVVAGLAAGLSWGMVGGYARRMVVDRLKGKALAVALAGTPVALAAGVPLGTFAGELVGWRPAFAVLCGAMAVLIAVVVRSMPAVPGQSDRRRMRNLDVLRRPGVVPILFTAFAWVTAHYILYTYVALYAEWAGLNDAVSMVLLVFGGAALVGIWIAGILVDTRLRGHVLASLAAFALATAMLGLWPHDLMLVGVGSLIWGATFGGAATSVQTAVSDAAQDGVDIVGAMLATIWNLGIAAGGAAGALLYRTGGVAWFFPTMLVLIAAAFAAAFLSRTSGFVPVARAKRTA